MVRQPLGRGLSALLGDQPEPESIIVDLGLDQIEPNADQPRKRFADEALDELAQSITSNGVIQPIVVRQNGQKYQIVAGERRWRAAQRAGLHRIPVVVKEVSDDKLLELALIENIQRQELNPIEEARAYRKLIDTIGLTQEMVAERVGRERTLIATSLRLLKLPSDVLQLIVEEKLSAGHGRALLMTDDAAAQRRIAKLVTKTGLSVRETERAIKRSVVEATQVTDKKRVTPIHDANMKSAETKLIRRLGTNVKILPKATGTGGKIEIEYYSSDDLIRLYQLIMTQ